MNVFEVVRCLCRRVTAIEDGGGGAPGSGTVTSVSVVSANGVSGTVATATSTPAITITLGAITPSSVTSTFSGNGAALTALNGSQITTGTVAAARIDAAIARLTDIPAVVPVNNVKTISATSYAIVAADHGWYLRFTNAAGCAITLNTDAVTPLPNGFECILHRGPAAGSLALSNAGVVVNGGALVPATPVNGSTGLKRALINEFDAI